MIFSQLRGDDQIFCWWGRLPSIPPQWGKPCWEIWNVKNDEKHYFEYRWLQHKLVYMRSIWVYFKHSRPSIKKWSQTMHFCIIINYLIIFPQNSMQIKCRPTEIYPNTFTEFCFWTKDWVCVFEIWSMFIAHFQLCFQEDPVSPLFEFVCVYVCVCVCVCLCLCLCLCLCVFYIFYHSPFRGDRTQGVSS